MKTILNFNRSRSFLGRKAELTDLVLNSAKKRSEFKSPLYKKLGILLCFIILHTGNVFAQDGGPETIDDELLGGLFVRSNVGGDHFDSFRMRNKFNNYERGRAFVSRSRRGSKWEWNLNAIFATKSNIFYQTSTFMKKAIFNEIADFKFNAYFYKPSEFRDIARFKNRVDFHGTQRTSHFRHGNNQDVYLRGGTNQGNVYVNDSGGGGLVVGTNRRVSNSTVTIDGNVHISEKGGSNTTWNENKYRGYTLWVQGGVVTQNLAIAKANKWSDFVFDEDYELKGLEELDDFIKTNHHLPHIPSEAEVIKDGYNVHEMNTKLLQTIEELTLYTIAQDKQLREQAEQLKALAEKVVLISSSH